MVTETGKLLAQRQSAESYSEWLEASMALDVQLGLQEWKDTKESQLYDYEYLGQRLEELRQAREAKEHKKLLHIVRTTFSRNLANMGNSYLYTKCYCGTKSLIEEYIRESELAIDELLNSQAFETQYLMNTLVQTRKSFGRTALVLSGGATLGLLHAGVLYELWSHNLLPKIISGSSAGSIVASIACIHTEDEFDKLWSILDVPLELFEKTGEEEAFSTRLQRFCKIGTFVDNKYIRELMQGLLGDTTFQEAYNRTGRILNVTVSAAGNHDMPRLLNYLTAPNVMIWSAVCASCSLPLVFSSYTLWAKNPNTGEIFQWAKASFIDGSVDNDLPLSRLTELFNINHFIACQVNPHIAPLLSISNRVKNQGQPKSHLRNASSDAATDPRWWKESKSLIFREIWHGLSLVQEAGVVPTVTSRLMRLIAQEYIGNINILPPIEMSDYKNLFKNPSPEISRIAMHRGRKATWPQLSVVRNHCAIELRLDSAIHQLRTRVIDAAARSSALHHSRRHSMIPQAEQRSEEHDSGDELSESNRASNRSTGDLRLLHQTPLSHSSTFSGPISLFRSSPPYSPTSKHQGPAWRHSNPSSPTYSRTNSSSNFSSHKALK